jgi:CBS domain containing-hemolysin-like protein
MSNASYIILLAVDILLTVGISFLCSILEAVLMSTPLSYIVMREDEGYRPAPLFKKYKTDIDRPIAAILAMNTIANTFGASLVGVLTTRAFGSAWVGWMSALVTLLILVCSEIIPKTIGTCKYRHLMGFTTRGISFLLVIMYPLVRLIQYVSNRFSSGEDDASISREEVSAMANAGEEEGVIDRSENKVIQNIIKLDNVKAYEAMTPRVVCSVAPESMTLKEYFETDEFEHHSRIPVYAESAEYITGYILRDDALEDLAEDKFGKTLKELRRDISFFNEETSLADIWEKLLKSKEQMALIIDDYGCFEGILTLEDIIETIFGLEIMDEMDEVSDMQEYAKERWRKRQKRYKKVSIPSEN